MRTPLDRNKYSVEASVEVPVREVLDSQDFDELFAYLLALYPKELKEEAMKAFDLISEGEITNG